MEIHRFVGRCVGMCFFEGNHFLISFIHLVCLHYIGNLTPLETPSPWQLDIFCWCSVCSSDFLWSAIYFRWMLLLKHFADYSTSHSICHGIRPTPWSPNLWYLLWKATPIPSWRIGQKIRLHFIRAPQQGEITVFPLVGLERRKLSGQKVSVYVCVWVCEVHICWHRGYEISVITIYIYIGTSNPPHITTTSLSLSPSSSVALSIFPSLHDYVSFSCKNVIQKNEFATTDGAENGSAPNLKLLSGGTISCPKPLGQPLCIRIAVVYYSFWYFQPCSSVSVVLSKSIFAQFVCMNAFRPAGSRLCLSASFHTTRCVYYHYYFSISTNIPAAVGSTSKRPIRGPGFLKLVGDQTLKPALFGSIVISPRQGFEKLNRVKRKPEQKNKREDFVHADEIRRQGEQEWDECEGEFVFVSKVWVREAKSKSKVAPLSPLCLAVFSEISASTGWHHCSFLFPPPRRDFPNPWNEHLWTWWTLWMIQDSQHSYTTITHTHTFKRT